MDSSLKESSSSPAADTTPVAVTTATEQLPENGLSKNALKKRRRTEEYLQARDSRTAFRKEKKRLKVTARQEQKLQEKRENGSDETPEEVSKCLEEHLARVVPVEGRRCDRRRKEFESKCAQNPKIVIDCDFEGLQTDKELTSLSQQLMYTYGVNKRALSPARLVLCGLYPALEETLSRISGYGNWICEKHTGSCVDVFSTSENQRTPDPSQTTPESSQTTPEPSQTTPDPGLSQLVYLTADSDTLLESLDSNSVYIIGGIVDRNRYPNLTLERAARWGIKTARLPIQDYFKLTGSKVLTVNQVFAILTEWLGCRSWQSAIEAALPPRKMQALKETNKETEESNEASLAQQEDTNEASLAQQEEINEACL